MSSPVPLVDALDAPFPVSRWQAAKGLLICLLLALLGAGMYYRYDQTQYRVTLRLDGQAREVRTHQISVGALLTELGLSLAPEDLLSPNAEAPLATGDTITIRRARAIWIEADGRSAIHRTFRHTLSEILQERGLELHVGDRLLLGKEEVAPESPLPGPKAAGSSRLRSVADAPPPQLRIERAIPLVLHDSGAEAVIRTTARTVGEFLWQAGIEVHLGDTVQPALEQPVSSGMDVQLIRSKPVVILADGRTIKTRTQGENVAAALAQEDIFLAGKDYCDPPLETPISDRLHIRIVRVSEEWFVESEKIPHDMGWEPDPTLEIDLQRINQRGYDGKKQRRYRVTYEDGKEVARVLERDWVAVEPQRRILVYGTKIVLHDLATSEGVKRYWRRVRVLITSYSPSTAGTPFDASYYGYTALGWRARFGVIAVDPTVIPMLTNIYVPGYGVGVAADTGGMIKGQHIDLCYDDDSLIHWYRWLDVYLLEPVPPLSQIPWNLPNWPKE